MIAAGLAAAIGLVGSILAGWQWTAYQDRLARDAAARTATTVTDAVSAQVQRIIELQKQIGNLIATDPDVTNRMLQPWLQSLDLTRMYPSSGGFAYFERVGNDSLPAFVAAISHDPFPGLDLTTWRVLPAGTRSYYCLERFGSSLPGAGAEAGTDMCDAANLVSDPLQAAARSGGSKFVDYDTVRQALISGGLPVSLADSFKNHFVLVSPVYAGGNEPATPDARAASTVGWIINTITGSELMDAAVSGIRGFGARLVGQGGGTVAASRAATGHQLVTSGLALPVDPELRVLVTQAGSSLGLVEGVVLGALIALLSGLLVAFVVHFGRSRDRLRYQALHDGLTGLPNRILLYDRAEQMLARARRVRRGVSVLYIDLDNFKEVNDRFGHHTGDALLVEVAARLSAAVREADTVGRLGGDEFLILSETGGGDAGTPDVVTQDAATSGAGTPHAGIRAVAERVMAGLAEPFELSDGQVAVTITASVGVATGIGAGAEELIRGADAALYQAKEEGKHRYAVFRS